MGNKQLNQQLEKLKKKFQKEVYHPSKGLMDILTESREIERGSKTILSGILTEVAEFSESQQATFEKMDFGVGKINKIVSDAVASAMPQQQGCCPDQNALKFYQATLEYFGLADMHTEDDLQLQRGILFNVTQIHGILQRAEKAREQMKDKKVFQMPKKVKKKEDKRAEGYGLGDLAALGLLLFKPIKWLGKQVWKGVKWVWNKTFGFFKNKMDDFWKFFSKKFPKTSAFIENMKGTLDNFFAKIRSKLPKVVDDVLAKIPKLLKAPMSAGLKVVGKALFWADMIYSFFSGFFDAKNITGKDQVDLKDKIISGVMGMLSSLTFGFVKPDDWYDVVMGDYGLWWHLKKVFNDIWEMMPDSIKKVFQGIGSAFTFAYDEADKVFKQFSGGWSMAATLEKLLDEVAAWVEKTITWKNLNPFNLLKGSDNESDVPDIDPIAQARIDKAKASRVRGNALPRRIDTSSKHLSDKKAFQDRKADEKPMMVNVPPPTVIQAPAPTQVSMFEADMQAILTGSR